MTGSHTNFDNSVESDGFANEELDLEDLELEYDQYKNSEFNNININNGINELNDNGELGQYDQIGNDKIKEQQSAYNTESEFLYNTSNVPSYHEHQVSLKEYYDHSLQEYFTFKSVKNYVLSIFPIVSWFPFYNPQWFLADLIAGITIGCVLVPQSMSYAQIATLEPQYGLYSSFIGAFSYSLFATSKDVCIGPVAVMSLETAKVIAHVTEKLKDEPDVTAPIIATTLALLCGAIAAGVGLLRLGFLVELISLNAVSGFMTGSAFNIMWGQVPGLMGYSKLVNTRTATYKVVINTLKHLPDTKLDAVFGLIPLFILYTWKWWCSSKGPELADKYYPAGSRAHFILKKFYFYAQALRNAVVIIVFTAISWSITRGKTKEERRITILGTVPSGLKDVGVFKPNPTVAKAIAPNLPASIIVLLLEHIAIAKSFGRINDYKVVPDQELIAIGVANLVGTFFMSYPATGSFSRSALKAKCNVRTPFSGVYTGACVLLALYCLTGAFFYIPKATLSAVIIHAVSDLLPSYKFTWSLWNMNPLDCLCFLVTVFITVFSSIENGIYFAMCYSCALLLFKVAFPAGKFLGRVEVAEVVNAVAKDDLDLTKYSSNETRTDQIDIKDDFDMKQKEKIESFKTNKYSPSTTPSYKFYTRWVPFDHGYTKELNTDINVLPPPPGVIVYRLTDSYTYLNCSKHYDVIFDEIKKRTRRGKMIHLTNKADRPWNDPGKWEPPTFFKDFSFKKILNRKKNDDTESSSQSESYEPKEEIVEKDTRPILKILCLDFSQVAQVDATALQSLVDLRKSINKYADRQVEYHFTGIVSPWVKKGLIKMGFGTINDEYSDESIVAGHISYHIAKDPIFEQESLTSSSILVENENYEQTNRKPKQYSLQAATGTNYPFFHIDIPDFSKWDV